MIRSGVLVMDKPQGFTSFDVIGKLRGILKMKKLGHTGTLDPMATGVLPVLIGTAARACDILPDERKAYRAGFQLGTVTDTQDSTGRVLETHPVSVSETDILRLMLQGCSNQEICDRLYISLGTVKAHTHNIFQKLNINRRSQLITVLSPETIAAILKEEDKE